MRLLYTIINEYSANIKSHKKKMTSVDMSEDDCLI